MTGNHYSVPVIMSIAFRRYAHYCAVANSSRRAAKRGQSVFMAVRSLRLGTSSIGTQQISMLSSSFALGSTVWPGFSKANTVV